MSELPQSDDAAATFAGAAADETHPRHLFRYLGGSEWDEYRAILAVFADTFFTEFSPTEVHSRLGSHSLSAETVQERLESLKRWGNLTVSSSVGNPASIEDYYRKRNRYLITRAGQQVHDLVERMLAGADEIADLQPGRLRDLLRHLGSLAEHASTDFARLSADEASTAVRNVFDIHERFSFELTGYFRQLADWQSRYDLDADQVQFLAGVLVDYVGEQLTDIERLGPPIGRCLGQIMPRLDALLDSFDAGLAARVEQAGLDGDVMVQRLRGSVREDWELLSRWFLGAPGRPAQLAMYTGQALAAVRTLTANVSRLSRLGAGTASRRSDFLRLAGFFNETATPERAHEIAAAALGLGSCRHAGTLAADADDPEPTSTPWSDAPRALVPVALRVRGERTQRGQTTPMRDRRNERRHMAERLEHKRVERDAAVRELLACADLSGRIDASTLSASAFALLRDLISLAAHSAASAGGANAAAAHGIRCVVRRSDGDETAVRSPDGLLTMHDVIVTVTSAESVRRPSPDRVTAVAS